ncbi:MAG: hypothetical protein E6K13_01395 [Methanobacteriota archaeon]|nr:MAG: hypothetical protein E6K13_01395 [Euryarchaeota archaeon]
MAYRFKPTAVLLPAAMPLRIRDYGEAHLKTDDDLFYFLQCATVATPGEPAWSDRAAEEVYALDRFIEYLRFLEKNEWISIRPTSAAKSRWTGKVRNAGKEWDIELVLKDSYPHVPPACRIPELMHYTDRKVDDGVLGLRICDMHMEKTYWWDDHASLALYLKREVSYWVQSVVKDMREKGWL